MKLHRPDLLSFTAGLAFGLIVAWWGSSALSIHIDKAWLVVAALLALGSTLTTVALAPLRESGR